MCFLLAFLHVIDRPPQRCTFLEQKNLDLFNLLGMLLGGAGEVLGRLLGMFWGHFGEVFQGLFWGGFFEGFRQIFEEQTPIENLKANNIKAD